MDSELQQAKRAAESGGQEERLALLCALRRAGRPLGEAWPGAHVKLAPKGAIDLEEALEAISGLDPAKLGRHLDLNGGGPGGGLLLRAVSGGGWLARRGRVGGCSDRVGCGGSGHA